MADKQLEELATAVEKLHNLLSSRDEVEGLVTWNEYLVKHTQKLTDILVKGGSECPLCGCTWRSEESKKSGCDLCGDFPAHIRGRCHPTAPLRLELKNSNLLVAYCYIPDCNKEVARFRVKPL